MDFFKGLFGFLTAPISNLAGEIIKRTLPEKVSEAERLRVQHELALALLATDWNQYAKEHDIDLKRYDLAVAELQGGNALTKSLAALHRPTWSFVMLGLFVVTVIDQFWGAQIELSVSQWDIFRTVLQFYFGGRTVEKVSTSVINYLGKK